MGDVGGEQVVHLVSEAGLEHQLGVGAAVPDREVEEAWPRHPVDDVAEGQRRQQVLGVKCLCLQMIGRKGVIIILLLVLFSVLLLCSSLLFILTAGACCAAWCCNAACSQGCVEATRPGPAALCCSIILV